MLMESWYHKEATYIYSLQDKGSCRLFNYQYYPMKYCCLFVNNSLLIHAKDRFLNTDTLQIRVMLGILKTVKKGALRNGAARSKCSGSERDSEQRRFATRCVIPHQR